jgi:hypothetical protein
MHGTDLEVMVGQDAFDAGIRLTPVAQIPTWSSALYAAELLGSVKAGRGEWVPGNHHGSPLRCSVYEPRSRLGLTVLSLA